MVLGVARRENDKSREVVSGVRGSVERQGWRKTFYSKKHLFLCFVQMFFWFLHDDTEWTQEIEKLPPHHHHFHRVEMGGTFFAKKILFLFKKNSLNQQKKLTSAIPFESSTNFLFPTFAAGVAKVRRFDDHNCLSILFWLAQDLCSFVSEYNKGGNTLNDP